MSVEQEVKALKEYIQNQGGVQPVKSTEFKLPRKFLPKGKLKTNHAIVIYIRTNSNVEISKVPIENDLVYIKQTQLYHQASADYILRYKQYPLLIIPEYSLEPLKVEPFKPKEHYSQVAVEGKVSYTQRVLIQMLRLSMMPKKTSLGNKNLIWIIVGLVVAVYLVASMFGVKII